MKYVEANDVKILVNEIIKSLNFFHILPQFVYCCRSKGSKSKRTIARIHGLGRIWQQVVRIPPTYIIEVISEKYDKLDGKDREKILIHELLHIPKRFSGGFLPHKGYINNKKIEQLYDLLNKRRPLKDVFG